MGCLEVVQGVQRMRSGMTRGVQGVQRMRAGMSRVVQGVQRMRAGMTRGGERCVENEGRDD